ncbi:MAG: 3',5'-cyclic-AMP phosphodiesterase [Methylococcales bacterium]|nr:3',5'-cyclic-AMP phosphodiesterase [Methylococcales bacterium]
MDSPLIILQITDPHVFPKAGVIMEGVNTEESFHQVLKQAHHKHKDINTVLVSGDLVQHPSLSSYQRVYKILKEYPSPTVCLPGNHDNFDLMQQVINTEQINCNKQLIFKHWQLICLNSKKNKSEAGYLSISELDYLQQTLQKTAHLYTLLAVHHHPVPTESLWMDTMMIENSDALFSLLEAHPQVKAISCGHIHQEMNIQRNNIMVLGTPSTCFQFKPKCSDYTLDDTPPGYRIFKLYPDGHLESTVHYLN